MCAASERGCCLDEVADADDADGGEGRLCNVEAGDGGYGITHRNPQCPVGEDEGCDCFVHGHATDCRF